MATGITFNSNSLQTANILTADIQHENIPVKTAQMFALSHANASKIPFVSYPSRVVKITGTIIDTTVAGLDARVDTFKGYFVGKDQNLDIDYNGGTRRYIATVNQLAVSRPGGLLTADFAIEFVCTQPFGQDTTQTTAITASGRTAAGPTTDNHTFVGTAEWQKPVATITYTALSGGTTKTVTWGNNSTGQQISVVRTWTTNDILVIDSVLRKVTVNGTEVAFTGAFPEFPIGAQTMTYTDTLTTRTYTYLVQYYALYL